VKNCLFEKIMKWWQRDDKIPIDADIIVSVSFGTFIDKLTNGSRQSTVSSIILQRHFNKKPMVIFGVFTPTAHGGNPEQYYREEIFKQERSISRYVGKVASSIEEAFAVKMAFQKKLLKGQIHVVVVCTDTCHSRRAGLVWENEFREFGCKIYVKPFDTGYVIQENHPMIMLRNRWKWLIVNIGVYCLWRVPLIYGWFRKNCKTLHQPILV